MFRLSLRHAACLATLFSAGLAHGQSTFRNVTTADGLGSDSVNAVVAVGVKVYAATDSGLSVSLDGGLVWTTYDQQTATGLASDQINDVVVSDGTIYAATAEGVCISANGGALWTCSGPDQGLPNATVNGLCVSEGVIYAATDSGLGISTDGGSSWAASNVEYRLTCVSAADGLICAAGGDDLGGMRCSIDGGASWTAVGPGRFTPIADVVVGDGVILAASEVMGLFVSSDGGFRWTSITVKNGLASNDTNSVSQGDGRILVGTDAGLSVSDDGGTTWTTSTTADGLGSNVVVGACRVAGSTYAATGAGLGIDSAIPENGTVVTTLTVDDGLTSNIVNAIHVEGPRICVATMDTRFDCTFAGGVSISNDGGLTWMNATTADGLPSDVVLAVCEDDDVIYAATQEGVGVSTDGGLTWTTRTLADGLGSTQVWDIDAADGVVYAATSFGGVDQDGGVSISTDQGETWQNFDTADGLSSNVVNSIFVADDGVLYAGVSPGPFTDDGGVCISSDGGASWTTVGPAEQGDVQDVFVRDGTIYAAFVPAACSATGQGGVGISTDGGKTWSMSTFWTTPGLGSQIVRAVAADDNGVIYAATTFQIACSSESSNEWPGGLAISRDGGSTWTNLLIENGLGSNFVNDVVVADGVLFAATQCTQAPGQVPGEGGLTMFTTICVADLDGDLDVDAGDLGALLALWGQDCATNPSACVADLDHSGTVDAGDIDQLICFWGECTFW